jgi:hypothetical protein
MLGVTERCRRAPQIDIGLVIDASGFPVRPGGDDLLVGDSVHGGARSAAK